MTKKRYKILSILLTVAILLGAFPFALPVFAEGEEETPTYLKSPDPGVTVECNEITWISAGQGSGEPGNSIVAANDMGFVGSDAQQTQISVIFQNVPEHQPTISCTSGGSSIVFSSPEYFKKDKKYTWLILNGTAEPDTILEFSITYDFNGKNYVSRAYSFVRAVSQPAGVYMHREQKTTLSTFDSVMGGSSSTYTVDFLSVLTAKNAYYSLGDFTQNSYESFRSSSRSISPTNDTRYNTVGSFRTSLYGGRVYLLDSHREILVEDSPAKPYVHIYMDTSQASSLADMNVSLDTRVIDGGGDNKSIIDISTGVGSGDFGAGAVPYEAWSPGVQSDANGTVGYSGGNGDVSSFGGKTGTFNGTATSGTYTIAIRACATDSSMKIWNISRATIGLVLHSVNKGDLRTTIERILNGTFYEDDPLNVSGPINKGANPQKWMYKSNWSEYNEAMREAQCILLKPNVTQGEIDSAEQALESAYFNLQLKDAEYSRFNKYAALADAAVAKQEDFYEEYGEEWYDGDTLSAVEAVLDEAKETCSILYQPQVDLWTEQLIEAYNGLRVVPADYTSLNATVARANAILNNPESRNIYVDLSYLAAAVAAVRDDLTKSDQKLLVQYETNINSAIDHLVIKPADYSEVERLENVAKGLTRSNYTNFNTVLTVLSALKKHKKLNITQQDIVDADAAALQAAINGLIPKPANYTRLEAALAQANALVQAYYTPASYAAVTAVLAQCQGYENISILEQSRVDNLALTLENAISALEMYDADYSEIEAAITRWETEYPESEREKLRESSKHAVEIAINSVPWQPKLKIDRQSEADELALRINLAISAVAYKSANYNSVELAVSRANALDKSYYADFSGVDAAIEAVNWNLGIDQQATVDAMADAINNAIEQLVPGPADYSRVNIAIARFEALNRSYYTRESIQAVESVIHSINWDLTIEQQADVITYAFDINEAILNLVEADADYRELNRVVSSISSNLNTLYTSESISILNDAVLAVDWTLKAKDQSIVDGYVTSINNAINNLVYLPGDYSEVDRQIAIGRDLIENGVLQPDGTYYEVSAKSAEEFETFVANIDRSYDIVHTVEIAQIAQSVIDKYQAFKYAESIYRASVKLATDKSGVYPGETMNVSVIVQTDYYTAASAIPVLYNAAYYDIVGSGTEAFTFGDNPYVNGAIKGGNTASPDKGYPASYSSTDKATWKYAYITVAPSSDYGDAAVTLDPQQVIATFQLRVKDTLEVGNDPIASRIWIDSAFLKTANNKGGKLYIGRYETEAVDTNIVGYGQTIDLTEADKTILIYNENAPAILTQLNEVLGRATAYSEDFYTVESYETYSAALTAGRAIVDNAAEYTIKDQATVNQAVAAIENAYNALVLIDADVSPIEAALALTPQYSEEIYTQASYLAFTNAVSTAQAILAEQDLTIVDNARILTAAQAVEDAFNALTLKDCAYVGELSEITTYMKPMFDDDDYDADALSDYNDVYNRCDTLLASDDISILNDEEALALVNEFYAKYIALERSALEKAVEDCAIEYDADCYVEITYMAYKTAYDTAHKMLEEEEEISIGDIGDLQECVQTLKRNFDALEIKPFEYEDEVWAALDIFPEDEDHIVAETLDAFWDAYDALDAFVCDKCDSWTALDNAEALALIEALQYAFDNLQIEPADLSELLEAIARIPENDESCYTTESYADYATALAAAQALTDATYDRQDDVDTAAQALNDAFDALELKPFTKLVDVNTALEAQPSLAQEAYYEEYWNAYAQALADLNEIVENAESLTIVDDADAVEKITAYNNALAALEADGIVPAADYTAVETAITNANTKLDEMTQTGNELDKSTVEALAAAIADVDYTLNALSQETVDAYASAINAAADALEYVKKFVIGSENGEIFVDNGYIFGFENIANEEDITAVITSIGNASVVVTPTDNGYGTGTTVELVDNNTSEVIQSLVVVVSADVDGDGYVDAFDVAIITECINNFENPEAEAVMLASDVFADGWLDATDLAYVMYMANYE